MGNKPAIQSKHRLLGAAIVALLFSLAMLTYEYYSQGLPFTVNRFLSTFIIYTIGFFAIDWISEKIKDYYRNRRDS